MQNWHDWAAYCADKMELPTPIRKSRFTILDDMEIQEGSAKQSHFVCGITGLVMPQFTSLGKKHLLDIGD